MGRRWAGLSTAHLVNHKMTTTRTVSSPEIMSEDAVPTDIEPHSPAALLAGSEHEESKDSGEHAGEGDVWEVAGDTAATRRPSKKRQSSDDATPRKRRRYDTSRRESSTGSPEPPAAVLMLLEGALFRPQSEVESYLKILASLVEQPLRFEAHSLTEELRKRCNSPRAHSKEQRSALTGLMTTFLQRLLRLLGTSADDAALAYLLKDKLEADAALYASRLTSTLPDSDSLLCAWRLGSAILATALPQPDHAAPSPATFGAVCAGTLRGWIADSFQFFKGMALPVLTRTFLWACTLLATGRANNLFVGAISPELLLLATLRLGRVQRMLSRAEAHKDSLRASIGGQAVHELLETALRASGFRPDAIPPDHSFLRRVAARPFGGRDASGGGAAASSVAAAVGSSVAGGRAGSSGRRRRRPAPRTLHATVDGQSGLGLEELMRLLGGSSSSSS
eukprot:PLAT14298.1.p1 GENE.PLAT14298.1~~PLAT14298.1.p1  ORF type:complete len:450 (+),score=29.14 PLAT14298.1:312-1661(+)